MNLYIEIENGLPKNHPALEENLIQAFGSVPETWEPFTRIGPPRPEVYQVLKTNEPGYVKVNGVWTDGWELRDMTAEEKAAKQQAVRDAFNAREQAANWSARVFDEATCTMLPPIPRPALDQNKINSGVMTFWCGADNSWKDTPTRPVDNKQYKFDFLAWQWVEAVN